MFFTCSRCGARNNLPDDWPSKTCLCSTCHHCTAIDRTRRPASSSRRWKILVAAAAVAAVLLLVVWRFAFSVQRLLGCTPQEVGLVLGNTDSVTYPAKRAEARSTKHAALQGGLRGPEEPTLYSYPNNGDRINVLYERGRAIRIWRPRSPDR
jgi:hypothetical protein